MDTSEENLAENWWMLWTRQIYLIIKTYIIM